MQDKSIEEVQELVGKPTYALVNGTWVPPPDRRLFTPDEFYELFKDESVVFMGDSMQRRAADTLHILIENRKNLTNNTHFLYPWVKTKIHHSRFLGQTPDFTYNESDADEPSSTYRAHKDLTQTRGRIDNLFLPFYQMVRNYQYEPQRNNTIFVVGLGAWNNEKRGQISTVLEQDIYKMIRKLHRRIPSSVQIYWKTAGWGDPLDWGYKEPHVKNMLNNYQIYLANKVAKEVIASINADNLKVIDWSREILPYSFDKHKFGMEPEGGESGRMDVNHWHIGVKGRMLLLQMLAWEVNQRKQLFPVPAVSNSTSSSSSSSRPAIAPSSSNTSSYGRGRSFEQAAIRKKMDSSTAIGTAATDDVKVQDVLADRYHSSSYLPQVPIGMGMLQLQEALSLLVVLLVAVAMFKRRYRG